MCFWMATINKSKRKNCAKYLSLLVWMYQNFQIRRLWRSSRVCFKILTQRPSMKKSLSSMRKQKISIKRGEMQHPPKCVGSQRKRSMRITSINSRSERSRKLQNGKLSRRKSLELRNSKISSNRLKNKVWLIKKKYSKGLIQAIRDRRVDYWHQCLPLLTNFLEAISVTKLRKRKCLDLKVK